MMRRQSGISVPLFALTSTESWGIGEFHDLPMFARWAAEAGQSLLQILPINEMSTIERSPYSAMSAMALDPIYVSLPQLVDFAGLGGELALDEPDRATLLALRQSPRIQYTDVRTFKERWLRRSFERFLRLEVSRGSPRALRFDQFIADEAWWLDEYAVFRALHALHDELPWHLWPEPLARADPAAVAHDAVVAAQARNARWLFIDTAGRLHTKHNLMQELQKVHRVVDRKLPGAPHEVLLVLDGSTGMNAMVQAREFHKLVKLTGLVITKLDGTSKGGAVVAIQRELGIPVKFIGVGEQAADLQAFNAREFAEALFSAKG